jgi:tetratricopeptide (TPR) repeat protein
MQSAKGLNMLTKEYSIIKDDPLIEYPPDTTTIIYYINGTIKPDAFQDTDTILIEKNINTMTSTTGLSILGISSITDIRLGGQEIMIIVIVLLILFYIVINFDIIDKIRNVGFGSNSIFLKFGSKKKISYIQVLVNDALDYLKTEDYDKAALIYREIKLSYEGANDYIKQQVYNESYDLCNQIDLEYALKVLEKAEYYIQLKERNIAISEFEKLENTYNKLSDKYKRQIDEKFQKVVALMKSIVDQER